VSGNNTSLPKKMFLVFHSKPIYQIDKLPFFAQFVTASQNQAGVL